MVKANSLVRPCSFVSKTKGIEGDWRELRRILTYRGFNLPQSLPIPLVLGPNEQALRVCLLVG